MAANSVFLFFKKGGALPQIGGKNDREFEPLGGVHGDDLQRLIITLQPQLLFTQRLIGTV